MGMLLVALLLTNLFISNIYITLAVDTIIFVVLVFFIMYNKPNSASFTSEIRKNVNVSQHGFKQGVPKQQGPQNRQTRSQYNFQQGRQGQNESMHKARREQVSQAKQRIAQESTDKIQEAHNLRGLKQKYNRFG